jgi:hypothetical protein
MFEKAALTGKNTDFSPQKDRIRPKIKVNQATGNRQQATGNRQQAIIHIF